MSNQAQQVRADALKDALVYRIDIQLPHGVLRLVSCVKSFVPNDAGYVNLVGAQIVSEHRGKDGKPEYMRLLPLVEWSETTTTMVKASYILTYALAGSQLSQLFFDMMSKEITDGPEDIGEVQDRPNA